MVTWLDEESNANHYVKGKCVEVTTAGLRIQLDRRIPPWTYVTLRIAGMELAVSGYVRHSRAKSLKATVGLELSQAIREQIVEALTAGKKVESAKRWQD
jgi:hypothetical protein